MNAVERAGAEDATAESLFQAHRDGVFRRTDRLFAGLMIFQWAMAILALSASIALADDFKTIRGKKYKNATISRVESDGIVVRTKSGIVKLYFTELPKEVQERFHYDASQASAAATPHQTPMNVAKPTDQAGSTGGGGAPTA